MIHLTVYFKMFLYKYSRYDAQFIVYFYHTRMKVTTVITRIFSQLVSYIRFLYFCLFFWSLYSSPWRYYFTITFVYWKKFFSFENRHWRSSSVISIIKLGKCVRCYRKKCFHFGAGSLYNRNKQFSGTPTLLFIYQILFS